MWSEIEEYTFPDRSKEAIEMLFAAIVRLELGQGPCIGCSICVYIVNSLYGVETVIVYGV